MSAAWHNLRIDISRLRADIEALSKIGRAPDGNLTRHAFAPGYEEARRWLKGRFAAAGIAARDDAAGNTIGRVGPATGPTVMSGSHIDTVPDGGPLDGAFGVLTALEVARVIKEAGLTPPRAFEAVAFIDEEGRYLDCLGSKAVTGALDMARVGTAKAPDDSKLTDAMAAAGFDPAKLGEAKRKKGDIATYLELHIEQGPVLEAKGLPIGIVTGIVGVDHSDFTFFGEPDHAGTTPMDLRKDAFTGLCEFVSRMRKMVLRRGTPYTRLTYGIVKSKSAAANIVPYEIYVKQELRDTDQKLVNKLVKASYKLADKVAAEYRLRVTHAHTTGNTAALMAPAVMDTIEESAKALGLPAHRMPSGAGHDAQVIARVADAGMIFVPSEGGRSHRRDEWTDWALLEKGANVLLQSVLRMMHKA
ncbi:MAG: Zn-dependent hydrolase [Alphaproteobacteria bacterium]|nr:Zn-dependent hydrolase [Alphaproteobacteria bacterium]